MKKEVIIIGAGISGLTAAIYLEQQGFKPLIIEATSRVGGRIKTDQHEGFLLDRGFQVLLTEYPEAKKLLDYEALSLKKFSPGAIVLKNDGKKTLISDPLRAPSTLFSTVFSSVGSIKDKLRILSLKQQTNKGDIESIFEKSEISALLMLQEAGFSEAMIQDFFKPFFAGIFLEKDLKTSRRMFDFVFRMFSKGFATIPEKGIEQTPLQLKNKLHLSEIKYNERVTHIENNTVFTNKNASYQADYIVLATEATGLVRNYKTAINTDYQGTSCVYFSALQSPIKGNYIALNASKSKIINNLCVPSNVSSVYAPKGKHLISLSSVGLLSENSDDSIARIKQEMTTWFGAEVQQWLHLKTYHIPYALPTQTAVKYELSEKDLQINERLFVCGDHLSNSSLNAAMKSGRKVAEIITNHSK